MIRSNLIVLPLNGNQLIAIEPIYIEAEQTKIPTLARVVLAQLLPDDRKIERARSFREAEELLVGAAVHHRGEVEETAGKGREQEDQGGGSAQPDGSRARCR